MHIAPDFVTSIIITVVSLGLLVGSSEKVVEKLIKLSNSFGVSKTFAGLTVMSITTSLPEISSHVVASIGILTGSLDFQVTSATVLGANIGSDVVQQTLILGIVVVFMGGFTFEERFLKHAYLPMIATTMMCIILGWDGIYSRLDGVILFGSFVAYMLFLQKRENDVPFMEEPTEIEKSDSVKHDVGVMLFGMSILLVSAYLLLDQVETIVSVTGLGGSFLGVITLGIAAASPEMMTAISGIRKKASGISLGTLIGSNIVNPLVAIGGGAIISTYWVPRPLVLWDLPMETVTAAMLLIYLTFNKRYLGRYGGLYLIFLYAAYLAVRALFFAVD